MILFICFLFLPLLTGTLLFSVGHTRFNGLIFLTQSLLSVLWGILAFVSIGDLSAPLTYTLGNVTPLLGITFKLDLLGLLFTAMTCIGFWYVWLFIWPDRKEDQKFIFFLSTLQSTLLALFTVNDLFSLFVLIESMTLLCSILIMYKRDVYAVRAGLYYLIYNSWAMILYLIGVLWLYQLTGTLDIDTFRALQPQLADTSNYQFALMFILTAVGIKSAIFPLFVWLPPAHSAAPTAVSALLSGLIVKVGLYMLLRLNLLAETTQMTELFMVLGLISAIFGALAAMLQSDMKRILAFHTVSQVGLITFGLGLGGSKGEWGAMLHLFNHFTFKSLLFLSVGLIVLKTGERRLKCYQGLWQWHKPLSLCLVIGILGITGFPLMNGALSKMLIKYGAEGQWATLALQAVNLGTLISFTKLFLILFGKPSEVLQKSVPPKGASLLTPFFMAVVTLVALPLELYLLSMVAPELSAAFYYKWSTDVFSYGLFAILAYVVYKFALTPILKKHPHFAHEDVSFNNGIIASIVFLAGMGLYMM